MLSGEQLLALGVLPLLFEGFDCRAHKVRGDASAGHSVV
jgi:hypothetical protein